MAIITGESSNVIQVKPATIAAGTPTIEQEKADVIAASREAQATTTRAAPVEGSGGSSTTTKPPVTIGLTDKEKQAVADALADPSMCQGTLQTYYTPTTFRITLTDGTKVYVDALTKEGAEAKAKDANVGKIMVVSKWFPTDAKSTTPSSTSTRATTTASTEDRDTAPAPSTPQAPEIKPVTMETYEYKIPSGKVLTFEAVNQDEAKAYVNRVGGLVSTLSQTGTRDMTEREIRDILSSAAKAGAMDYAKVLVKYGQTEGDVIPVREGDSRQVFFVDKDQWESLPADYKRLVTEGSFDDLTAKILRGLPDPYRELAESVGNEQAIARYAADMDRINEIVDTIEPYKDGNAYSLVSPLRDRVVTADDLVLAGFDGKDVNKAVGHVDRMGDLVQWFDRGLEAGDYTKTANMNGTEVQDLVNAIKEAGLFSKYRIAADWAQYPNAKVLGDKWTNEVTDEDKFTVAEIYAGYPSAGAGISAVFRQAVTQAPEQRAGITFAQTMATGAVAGVMAPFVKERWKANAEAKMANYKVLGGYDIRGYLEANPYDATTLANAGVPVQAITDAQEGKRVIASPQGATRKDWAVAGLIVAGVGAGGAGVLLSGSTRAGAALLVASGTAQLGLGGIATVDTIKNWHQMSEVERGIAVAFDVMLIAGGALALRGGYRALTTKQAHNVHITWRRGRKVIIENYPFASQARVGTLLDRIQQAIQTNNRQALVDAAEQLQRESARVRNSAARGALVAKAKLLQAAPDDYVGLGRAIPRQRALVPYTRLLGKGAKGTGKGSLASDILQALKNTDADLRAVENALRRTTSRKRYNTLVEQLANLQKARQRLATQVATKTKPESWTEKVVWPDKAKVVPSTRALTTVKTTTKAIVKVPEKILVGTKKVPIPTKTLTTTKLGKVAQKYGVSIWDITKQTRKLPKGVQEEIAIINPLWQPLIVAVTVKQATQIASKLSPAVRQKLRQEPAPAPAPQTKPQPEPQLAPMATQTQQEAVEVETRTKPEPKEETEPLPIYPYQHQAQQVKTLFKRKLRKPSAEGDLPETRKEALKLGIQTWRQGIFYISGFPPYRTTGKDRDYVWSRKVPPWGVVGKGKGSPQRTLRVRGGKVPRLQSLPMGVVTAEVKGGRAISYRRKRRGSRIIRGDV